MRRLAQIFLAGLAVVVPVVVTAWLLFWLGTRSEKLLGGALKTLLPEDWYVPGLGLLLGILLIFGIGVLTQLYLFQRVFGWGETLLNRIPLVKTVYGSIRDIMQILSPSGREKVGRPVILRLPGHEAALLGFVTRREPGAGFPEGTIAVYLPLSYQVGGYTVFVPPDAVEELDLGVEDAMRFVLTAGLGRRGNK